MKLLTKNNTSVNYVNLKREREKKKNPKKPPSSSVNEVRSLIILQIFTSYTILDFQLFNAGEIE
jgi:hypothetical protein